MLEQQIFRNVTPVKISTSYYYFKSPSDGFTYIRVLKNNIISPFASVDDINKWSLLNKRLERLAVNDPMRTFYDIVGQSPEGTRQEISKLIDRYPYEEYRVEDEITFFQQHRHFFKIELVLTPEEISQFGIEKLDLYIHPDSFEFINSYKEGVYPIISLAFYDASIPDYWEIKSFPNIIPEGFIKLFIRCQRDSVQLYDGDNIFHPEFLRRLVKSGEFDEGTLFFSDDVQPPLNISQLRKKLTYN